MPTDEVQKILFIRTDRIGDVLMNLPAVRRLRQNFPKAWLTWMVDRGVAPLLRDHPDVDEIFEIDAAKLSESGLYRRELIARVRRIGFDIGIAANAQKFLHWMLFRCGVRKRAGWRRKWAFLLNSSLPDDKSAASRHEIDSNLALVGLVAPKTWDGSWNLPVDARAETAVEKRLRTEFPDAQKPLVVLHAGSSKEAKRWPIDRFAQIGRRLSESGASVLLIGGSEEEAQSRTLASRLPAEARDWTGATDLRELSALLHSPRVKTLLSSDSGPVHIAWLHGKPVVALYAKDEPGSDPARWGPRNRGSIAIHKPIADISVEDVWTAVQRAIAC